MRTERIGLLALLCIGAFISANVLAQYSDQKGHTYQSMRTDNGFILSSNDDVLFIGLDCSAKSRKYGSGIWESGNGGFTIKFQQQKLSFARQEIPLTTSYDCDFAAIDDKESNRLEKNTARSFQGYNHSAYLVAFASGDFSTIRQDDLKTTIYLYMAGVDRSLMEACRNLSHTGIHAEVAQRLTVRAQRQGQYDFWKNLTESLKSNNVRQIMADTMSPVINPNVTVMSGREDGTRLVRTRGCGELAAGVNKGMFMYLLSWNIVKLPIGLYKESPVSVGWWAFHHTKLTRQQEKLVNQQMRALNSRGQNVKRCQYGPMDEVRKEYFRTYYFWEDLTPPEFDLMVSQIPGGKHPFNSIGKAALDTCPGTLYAAVRLVEQHRK